MKKRLRVPTALAVVVLGGGTAGGLVSSISCHDEHAQPPPTDAASCAQYCIPHTFDAGIVCNTCADAGHCPSGCDPIG
jgi:hypothetical protein